ncbi:hypothetical protein CHH28_19665 [Bacterioplanes sanyensis]|uniref:Uncharacterized protein n=1 Tax=Bacterioplanes sanyensis TaxID=1249553 RepID=A0A222FPN3_9GAMM|nr:hypothetical protein [Bacterioplanes sanyensis]ASP40750.1 hypothetical protein CHH28_19665 [Bacterioplanes sanyensis]
MAQIEAALAASGLQVAQESGDAWGLFQQNLADWLSVHDVPVNEFSDWPQPLSERLDIANELLLHWPQLRQQALQLARAQQRPGFACADHDFERRCLAWKQRLQQLIKTRQAS